MPAEHGQGHHLPHLQHRAQKSVDGFRHGSDKHATSWQNKISDTDRYLQVCCNRYGVTSFPSEGVSLDTRESLCSDVSCACNHSRSPASHNVRAATWEPSCASTRVLPLRSQGSLMELSEEILDTLRCCLPQEPYLACLKQAMLLYSSVDNGLHITHANANHEARQ